MQATENSANKRYLLYGKASLRQIRALWLVLARSGFCSTDRVHGNGPRRVFLFWSRKLQNLQSQQRKKKCGHCHSSSRNYQKKLKRLKFYWDFKDGWRRRTFSERVQYHREHLETFDSETETGITESQEAIDDFINQQKSANTNKKKATDMIKKPSWNFRINNCFCQIPLKIFFEVLFKLM